MLLAVTHQLTGVKEQKKKTVKAPPKADIQDKEIQYFLVFGPDSKYLEDPELLIAEINHAVKDIHLNPRQGIFLLELASQVGARLIESLIEMQCLTAKHAVKSLPELRDLTAACCNILNHITIASDNAAIFSKNLAWAPEDCIEHVRDFKGKVFSLFGVISKFSEDLLKVDWHGFSNLISDIVGCYEIVRRDSEKQRARMKFYHGIKNGQ